MQIIKTELELNNFLEANAMVLTYFSGEKCHVCKVLKPKITELINSRFPSIKLVEIPTEDAPELIAKFTIFSIPAVLFWVEGREYIREVRSISLLELEKKIEKIFNLYQ